MSSVVTRERVLFWTLGLGLGVLIGMAVAPSVWAKDDAVVLHDAVSEIEVEKAPDPEIDGEMQSLARIESRYREKLPSLTQRKARKSVDALTTRANVVRGQSVAQSDWRSAPRNKLTLEQKPTLHFQSTARVERAQVQSGALGGQAEGWRTWRTGSTR